MELTWRVGARRYRAVETPQLDDDFAAIAVSPDPKLWMRSLWEGVVGLTEQTLFPDFDGFAAANSAAQALPLSYWDE